VFALALAVPSMAHAAAIVFNPQPQTAAFPDVHTNASLLQYVVNGQCSFAGATATGCLTIQGTNLDITRFAGDGGVAFTPLVQPGDFFQQQANINSAGTMLGGSLLIRRGLAGPVPFNAPDNTTILSGSLTQFGLDGRASGNDAFTFL